MTEVYYTCIDCGKNHLIFGEIAWMKDDKNGDIDESTVRCVACHLRFISLILASKIPEEVTKPIEKTIKKASKKFENKYNRRTLKRAMNTRTKSTHIYPKTDDL
jgi:DNA-directed RNA polymerase subunit RPC12/RpoP